MAITLKELVIKLKVSADGVKAGLDTAANGLKNINKLSDESKRTLGELSIAAGAAFAGLGLAVKKGADAFSQYQQTLAGFRAQLNYIGEDFESVMNIVAEKTKDGLISESDYMAAIKNLTSYGMSVEKAAETIDRLKDSAAVNRQAHYSLSEAVRVTTEGIKNENSVLSDAAGVQKNISKMIDEYAQSVGKSANALTQAEKAEAVYAATLTETEAVIGEAAKQAGTLAGAASAASVSGEKLAQAFGAAMEPTLIKLVTAFGEILTRITDFVSKNKELVEGVTVATGLLLGFIAAIGAYAKISAFASAIKILAADFGILGVSLATVAPALIAVAGAIGIVTAAVSKYTSLKKEYEELAEKALEFERVSRAAATNENYDDKKDALDKLSEAYSELTRQTENAVKAAELMNKIKLGQMLTGEETKFLNEFNSQMDALGKTLEQYGIRLEKTKDGLYNFALTGATVKVKIDDINKSLADFIPDSAAKGAAELTNETERLNDELKKTGGEIETLDKSYRRLAEGQNLSYAEMSALIKEYPEIAKYISETNDLTLDGGRVAEEAAARRKKALKDQLGAEAAALSVRIENARAELNAEKQKYIGMADAYKTYANLKGIEAFAARMRDVEENREQAKIISDQIAALNDLEKQYNETTAAINALDLTAAARGSGGGGGVSREIESSLKKQLELLEEKKALTELSAKEELEYLTKIKAAHAQNAEDLKEIDKKIYAARRTALNEYYGEEFGKLEEESAGLAEKIDYAALIDKVRGYMEELKSVYADYPETLKEKLLEAEKYIEELTQARGDKLTAAAKKEVNAQISEYDRLTEYMREMSGLALADGEIFKFTKTDELEILEKQLNVIATELERVKEISEPTDADTEYLAELAAEYENYTQKRKILTLQAEKEIQAEQKKTLEDRIRQTETANKETLAALKAAYDEETRLLKESNQTAVADIKNRYAEQIALAKAAAAEEIKVYEARIKVIDDLMKQEDRADRDESLLDRIRRAKEQLAFEADDANKYELAKEIANLEKEYGKNQSRDRLTDEKAALTEQINALKDSGNERVKVLEESRDAELEALNQTLDARLKAAKKTYEAEALLMEEYAAEKITELEKELGIHVKTNAAATEDLNLNIAKRKENLTKFYKDKEKKAEENVRNERAIFDRGINDMINDLNNKLYLFAEAGRSAGNTWGNNFQLAAYDAMQRIMEFAANNGAAQASANSATYNVTQNFNVPVVSPSMAARETETLLAGLTRAY
jgi:hypothetical protein